MELKPNDLIEHDHPWFVTLFHSIKSMWWQRVTHVEKNVTKRIKQKRLTLQRCNEKIHATLHRGTGFLLYLALSCFSLQVPLLYTNAQTSLLNRRETIQLQSPSLGQLWSHRSHLPNILPSLLCLLASFHLYDSNNFGKMYIRWLHLYRMRWFKTLIYPVQLSVYLKKK